jgi:hypothetical protein
MYRPVAALDDDSPLPLGVNIAVIFEAILDNEFASCAIPNESL